MYTSVKIALSFMFVAVSCAFITSGNERRTVTPGQFPSVVSINIAQYNQHYCGGVIVGKRWVLTTARCVINILIEHYDLIVGSTHLSNGTKMNITEVKIHPNFDEQNLNDDVALVKTQEDFAFSDNLQIAEVANVTVNSTGFVVGWDLNRDDAEYIKVRLLSSEECVKLEDDANERNRTLGQVCAYGGVGVGICIEDKGNPLIVDGKLVGLASYTVNSCGLGYPDVYTDVSYYQEWIKRNTV